jgi:hypothetical protein
MTPGNELSVFSFQLSEKASVLRTFRQRLEIPQSQRPIGRAGPHPTATKPSEN